MKLYIAEKPSLARAIAAALDKNPTKQQGYLQLNSGDRVTWCIGHLLSLAEPDEYDPRYKKWRLEDLPILPSNWRLKPKKQTHSQLKVIKQLIKKADQIVHAGDPDREGQLLVDEVIHFAGISNLQRSNIQRLLISDMNTSAVKRALASMQLNSAFSPLSRSALARSRADWLYGMNMSRAVTLSSKSKARQKVLSVGRVQTPVLGLVVERDRQIEQFQPKPFYQVIAQIAATAADQQALLTAQWQPSAACKPYQDEEGRVLSKPLAEKVQRAITQQPALLEQLKQEPKKLGAPLLFNLSALQIEASRQYKLSAQQVLDICQQLYEKHKLITYPRSDCRYLPKEQLAQAAAILKHLQPQYADAVEAKDIDTKLRSKAWNDAKVGAHHAIIPTLRSVDKVTLNASEQRIYGLVAKQYVMQFMADYQYAQISAEFLIAGGTFLAKANVVQQLGWKQLAADKPKDGKQLAQLQALKQGQQYHCIGADLAEKMTQAPAPFTEATLLSAMTGIARYVTQADLKKILRETDGLGTEATRAGILELLIKRTFLIRQGRQIRATDLGKQLIGRLPASMTAPDMTAQWESRLTAISESKDSYQAFMSDLEAQIKQLLAQTTA